MPSKTSKPKKDSGTYRALRKVKNLNNQIEILKKQISNRKHFDRTLSSVGYDYLDESEIRKLEQEILSVFAKDARRLEIHRINNIRFS